MLYDIKVVTTLGVKNDTSTDNHLFQTKFNIPVIRQNLVTRERIEKELEEGFKGRLTLLLAPAGYGKTTAVSAWIMKTGAPVAWFSIDEFDNNPKRFWSYLIAALDIAVPGLKKRFSKYFSTGFEISESFITIFVDELCGIKHDLIMVLDDYHVIKDETIHESLSLLIRYLPPKVHIVIISRSKPPFYYVRLQTIGQAKEIGSVNLQFTVNEIEDFCKRNGKYLSHQDLFSIKDRTEGWAAGLRLMLEDGVHDIEHMKLFSASGTDCPIVASYLEEEVMNRWDSEEKQFMINTSFLPSMTGDLCDAVTGRNDGTQMLKRLFEQNAFVIQLDIEGCWYRYHHLYSEFLKKLFEKNTDEDRKYLFGRAGEWYAHNGFRPEAFVQLLRSGRYDTAIDIIQALGREMLKTGDFYTLIEWIELLPEDAVRRNVMLCLTYAWALLLTDRIQLAFVWIQAAEDCLGEAFPQESQTLSPIQLKGEIATIRGFIGIKQNNPKLTLGTIGQIQDLMLKESLFCAYGMGSDRGEASLLSGMLGVKGQLTLLDRDFLCIYEKTRGIAPQHYGYMPVLMGELLFERNRIDESIPHLIKGMTEAEKGEMGSSLVPAVITLAKTMFSKGNISGAFDIVNEGDKKLNKIGGVHMLPLLNAFRTRLNIATGRFPDTEAWLLKNCLDIQDEPSIKRMYEQITLARVLFSSNKFDDCVMLLTRLLLLAKQEQNLYYTIELLNLSAIVYDALGQSQRAMEMLHDSLLIGEKEGYERIYIEEGIPMAALLGRFLKSNYKSSSNEMMISPKYIRDLTKSTREYCITLKALINNTSGTGKSVPIPLLTKRETEVLHLLDSELTNAEIAYTLNITLNTVKVNCSNIYRKLDVKNREQALRYAHENRILK